MTKCIYSLNCSGCSNWEIPYQEQITSKISHLETLLKNRNLHPENKVQFISCGEHGLRHRMDFTIEFDEQLQRHKSGFYDQDKKIMQIDQCLQLAPELQMAYSEFSRFEFFFNETPVRKGSIRLRVGPTGMKGCWLDFSNLDIKYLLEDQKVLAAILDAGFYVEIGQKGKRLTRINGQLKLSEAEPQVWIKTFALSGQELELKCLVSDFTQPSLISAKTLVTQVLKWTEELKNIKSILEFGAGIGQFTLSFLKSGFQVDAIEINESAAVHLRANAEIHNLAQNLDVQIGDFHKQKISGLKPHELVFVNPARSGLKDFTLEVLRERPDYVIYVSCFPESMTTDITKLSEAYSLCNIIIIDQFPQTQHYEICGLLKKLN